MMKRITTSLLIAAASCAMIAGCTANSAGRGFANRNGPGQGACLANGNGPGQNARQFNCPGPNPRMFNGNGPGQGACLANGNGPGQNARQFNGPGPNPRMFNGNGPAQGACLANGNGPAQNARQFNGPGPNPRMFNGNGPGQGACLANGNGPGPRNAAANGNGRGRGGGPAMGSRGRGPGSGPGFGPANGNAGPRGQNGNGPCCGANGACQIPVGVATPVNDATADALRATLEDELTARAFYAAILAKHGDVRPFANIIRAEERHAQAIRALMQLHQVDGSGVTARALPEIPGTVPECAKLAAQLERDNVALYDRFIQATAEADIKAAFERLRAASLDNHLPAFERIAGA
jgi:hypothetical protein